MNSQKTFSEERIAAIVDELKDKAGALLPVLHAIQDEIGYIPSEAVPIIANKMNLTRAEVHGVITFYQDFRQAAPGRHILKICQAESCQAMGSDAVTTSAKKHLRIDFRQTTGDRAFTLEAVYCLGACTASPSIMLDGRLYGRVTPQRLEEVLREAREQA